MIKYGPFDKKPSGFDDSFVIIIETGIRGFLLNGDSEKELIARCRGGDRSAYVPLVRAHSRRVFAICLGRLGNVHDAEDMAQQTFLKGFANIGQIRHDERFGSWIGRIAKNLCIDFIRQQKLRHSSLLEVPESNQNNAKEYPALERALAKLPEDSRLVLMLFYFDGQSTRSIAEVLSISEAAAQTRLSRARQQLRKLLEAEKGAL
jgi:RNA polymerase sigma-70 factor (ECF subfamily)